jgi:haloalkane dehalogenase
MELKDKYMVDQPINMQSHAESKSIDEIHINYHDHGEKDWPVIFLFHGIPTYSYTFRKIIPLLNKMKIRTICPDLPGFGFSDNLPENNYSLEKMSTVLAHFIQSFNFKEYYLYANDWGTIISLLILSGHPKALKGVILSNGYLPIPGQKTPFHFKLWKYFTKFSPILIVSKIINQGSFIKLSQEEKANYDLPFKNGKSKSAIRILPNIIPIHSCDSEIEHIQKAWYKLQHSEVPLLTLFSTHDPYTKKGYKVLQSLIPGAKGQDHKTLKAKHFITEDAPNELAKNITNFIRKQEGK